MNWIPSFFLAVIVGTGYELQIYGFPFVLFQDSCWLLPPPPPSPLAFLPFPFNWVYTLALPVWEEKNYYILQIEIKHIRAKKKLKFSFYSDIFVSKGREMHLNWNLADKTVG